MPAARACKQLAQLRPSWQRLALEYPDNDWTKRSQTPRKSEGRIRRMIMIRKLRTGQYRLYSRKVDPRTGKRRNLGTFTTREEAEQHERAVQFFKHRH